MPKLHPLTLFCPATNTLEAVEQKNIRGPEAFVDLLVKANSHQEIKDGLNAFINNKTYRSFEKAALFWYSITTQQGVFEGLLGGVMPKPSGQIVSTHEAVLAHRVELFSAYLQAVSVQAEPVLLLHENSSAAEQLGKQIHQRPPEQQFMLGSNKHQLWQLDSKETALAQKFSQNEAQFHLADGHHRYASTLGYAEKNGVAPLLFSFLVAKDQLQNKSFSWAIKDAALAQRCRENIRLAKDCKLEEADVFFQVQGEKFHCTAQKETTVTDYILDRLMAIPANKRTDLKDRIDYYAPGSLSVTLIKKYAGVVDYHPLSIEQIIALAKAEKQLPPKSTFIYPKLPTGLFFTPLESSK